MSQVAHQAGAEATRNIASPSQGYPQHYDRQDPLIHMGEETQCGMKFLVRGNNMTAETRLEPPTSRSEVQRANH